MIGIIPGKSDLIVLDVDEGFDKGVPIQALVAKYKPATLVRTPRGYHLYFARGERDWYPNSKWSADGFSGDLRGDAGFVIAWDPLQIMAAIDLIAEFPTEFAFPDEVVWPKIPPGELAL